MFNCAQCWWNCETFFIKRCHAITAGFFFGAWASVVSHPWLGIWLDLGQCLMPLAFPIRAFFLHRTLSPQRAVSNTTWHAIQHPKKYFYSEWSSKNLQHLYTCSCYIIIVTHACPDIFPNWIKNTKQLFSLSHPLAVRYPLAVGLGSLIFTHLCKCNEMEKKNIWKNMSCHGDGVTYFFQMFFFSISLHLHKWVKIKEPRLTARG